jgi:single-strand DNA-binding protein
MIGVFRIGKDAELRELQDGGAVCNLALASNYGRKGNDGKRPTQWVDAALWGKRAEALEQYLLAGQQVYCVINDVHIEEYQKRDGGTGSKLMGTVSEIELVGGRPEQREQGGGERRQPRAAPAPAPRRAAAPAPAPRGGNGFDDMDDDIPF